MISEIKDIVSQIKVESGAEAVRKSRQHETELTTGIKPIDDILDQHRRSPDQGDKAAIFELVGLPGSGKTQLVYYTCATFALPIECGGHERRVALIDISGRFDVRHQHKHMEQRVRSAMQAMEDSEVDRMVHSALSRIHVYSPVTTMSAIATLALLGKDGEFGGLVIDGLGSNHWIDQSEGAPIRLASRKASGSFRMQQVLVDTLRQVQRQMGCVVVVTNLVIMRAKTNGSIGEDGGGGGSGQRVFEIGGTLYRDHMIPRWRSVLAGSFLVEAVRDGSDMLITVGRTTVMRAGH